MSRCITDFAQACTDLADMTARKDVAYFERNLCAALIARMALASGWRAGIARTAIEGWSEDWHGCVYVDLPTGQVSWHYHDSQAHLFSDLPAYTGAWDGHDTPEKYRRVAEAFATGLPVLASDPPGVRAAQHLVRRLTADPRLAWLIGPGSESYELLTAAAALSTGCTVDALRALIERDLKTTPWPSAQHG